MDIGNYMGSYMDMYKAQASSASSKLESELNADYSKVTDDKLMDACKQFEAYFLEQVFKEMMKTIPESENNSTYTTNMLDYYKDSMIQEIASASTEQQGLGLANMLYEQMKRNYGL